MQCPNYVLEIARRTRDGDSLADIAADLHVSVEWVELIMSSDSYQAFAHDYKHKPNEQ